MYTHVTDFNSYLFSRKGNTLLNYFSLIVFKKLFIYCKTFHFEKFIHLEKLVIALTQAQEDHAVSLVQYGVCMGSLLKPVRLLLDVIPSLTCIKCTSMLRLHSIPLPMSSKKILHSIYPGVDPWETSLHTGLHLDTVAINYNSLDADIQPALYPPNSPSINPIFSPARLTREARLGCLSSNENFWFWSSTDGLRHLEFEE